MSLHAALPFCLASTLLVAQAPAQPEGAAPARLIQEIGTRSELMANLEALCDDIGPRLTGSPSLRKAQAWAMAKLRAYGATNVHEETYDLGRPWHRGVAQARLLNANGLSLDVAQVGWTEGTKGVLRADVALLNVKTLAEFRAQAPRLAGKVVLVLSRPRAANEGREDVKAYEAELAKAWREARIALALLPSRKDYGLQDMAGGPSFFYQARAAFITREHANLLQRLVARGLTPRVEAELGGGFGHTRVQASNVVADLPGTDHPEEVVILGAHQDSWDLGSGATDNGTGTVVALEVLRALHAANLRPRRTLRVVLFSGEEQDLLGSRAYVARHAADLSKIQAVLIEDSGSGRISGFPDMKVEAWYAPLVAALAPAKSLGATEVPYGIIGGSDQTAFFERGIPAFAPIQDPLDYASHTQHSQVDAFDHVVKEDLVQGAQVMAVTAWGLLQCERLPHQAPKAEP
ncbi:aminopeptidase [Geothrix limicola]|uniref:Carboxypeptidase Q n=1 Tax=Geothrix limicola TaxID=2927978 RepID=A0ABQ5QK08_9BACT|nr:M20/M25/M40 family metallo-hydrolase [Geothrix limicola]GLH74510.1 aminopeptidase [Geothrix limicola]